MSEPQAKILVVDDEPKNVKLMAAMLAPLGYAVVTAHDGEEALQQVQRELPDLILLDVMMPIMDGLEVCRRLKDDPETRLIPIIIMTALGQVEDRIRGIQAGADDFLTKPVNDNELLARIQTSLRLKRTVEHKLERLKGTQEYLAKFVPQSVKKWLAENPDILELPKTDQDISALFIDVSGYTRLSEDMRQTADFIVEKYFSRFLDSIHGNEGDVTETSGDGLMAIFPDQDPKQHPRKAVKTALEILQTSHELNEQLKGIFEPISVHMGINSGIALIGPTKYEGTTGVRWVYTALGPVVNLAARIGALAEDGTILIGPETARRIEGAFATEEFGKRELKNIKGEVMIHQIAGLAHD